MSSSKPASQATLVNIGTHSLALYVHGQTPESSLDPVVLFVSGVASSSLIWAAVIRQLPSSLRTYTYDRSGYGNSQTSSLVPTAENVAVELAHLIEHAPISNPLIIVGHSWAGVVLNEFVAIGKHTSQIIGLVLVDANHETQLEVLNLYDANLQAMFAGIETYSGRGIPAEHKLTQEEWDAFIADEASDKHNLQARKELMEYARSFDTLRQKRLGNRQPLLGNKPVYVIGSTRSRDWGRLYQVGVERGNGTEEQRSHVREFVETADEKSAALMKQHLKLSTRGELVFARKSGHFIQLTQPDLVVDGVLWVLGTATSTAG